MAKNSSFSHEKLQEDFRNSLIEFSREHRAALWSGTFAEFLEKILPSDAKAISGIQAKCSGPLPYALEPLLVERSLCVNTAARTETPVS